jgi:hypothetical protein
MTSEEIAEIINAELKKETDLTNVYGLDLTTCLIKPHKQLYIDANNESESDLLWTVLEETADENGYKIFFDDEAWMFGLGIKSHTNQLINIGYYGTFLETLYGM